ncbi:intracellular protein transport protein USO1 isoform X2 [Macadamia integrifolia]|uniref:intracellular protein transport protein USO1 isoform X2 n=1 Tax=Macadamia integrifolia TaxID=60698 RepID=UPI001C4EDE53|nr:intracellular protein transport protein USO1 isoform X2 [Macadamia integrifolia]
MSSSFRSDYDSSFNIDELLHLGMMCTELRREKDMLRESQSQSTELIKRLEFDIESLLEARLEDGKYIQELETEVRHYSVEMRHLQDQLNLRSIEANCLGEHVQSLEMKLAEFGNLNDKMKKLREELDKSESERIFLMQELENRAGELHDSRLYIEKLDESISSMALEYQCEIESTKLDLITLEQSSFETKKFQEAADQEKPQVDELVEEFEFQFQNYQKMIECLEKENKDLKEKLGVSERNAQIFCQKVGEHLGGWLEDKERSGHGIQSSGIKLENMFSASEDMSTWEKLLGPLLSKMAVVAASDEDLKEMEKMSHQIHEYELLVEQLKEELREEKSKAKEEAEDLTQEMAELRYQIMDMLEQECKRRAFIEQVSLRRIVELEEQVRKEQRKSFIATRQLHEMQKLAESRSMEVRGLENVWEGLSKYPERDEVCSCGNCPIARSISASSHTEKPVKAESLELDSNDDDTISRVAITWHPNENEGSQRERISKYAI